MDPRARASGSPASSPGSPRSGSRSSGGRGAREPAPRSQPRCSPPSSPAPQPRGTATGRRAATPRRVTAVTPKLAGLTVQVLQGDDQLQLRNDTGQELVIEGYDGEPYLRFAAGRRRLPQRELAGDVPERGALRRRRRAGDGLEGRRAALGAGRARARVRLARPPHPLDEHDRPAEGARRRRTSRTTSSTGRCPAASAASRSRSRAASTTSRRPRAASTRS